MDAHLKARLTQLRQRLLAANLRSRSLRLRRTTRSGAFDLTRLADLNGHGLERIRTGMGRSEPFKIKLLAVKGVGERERDASEDLRRLANASHRTWMEVGEDELLLGWPFVEGKFDNTWLRAPLLLYPVALTRTRRGKLMWELEITGRPDLNEVLAQALFRMAGVRLSFERLVELDDDNLIRPDDASWTALEQWMAEGGVELHGAGTGLPDLEPIEERDESAREGYQDGRVELRNHLVLGRFPQSSSNVLSEYNALEERPELLATGPAAELLAIDSEAVAAALARETSGDATPSDQGDDESDRREAEDARVLPSDASQEAVIRALDGMGGTGLVVRGPPGTGKSQLIANLVGQAIHRGERVLVVCQKRAALDVVEQRLEHLGLSEPLALVHDIHRDRESFCARLAGTLESALNTEGQVSLQDEVRVEKRALAELEAATKRYKTRLQLGRQAFRAMTEPRAGGRSLAELCERALEDDGRALPDLSAVAADVVEEDLLRTLPEVETLASDARPFATPHPLAVRTDWSSHDAADLASLRDRLKLLLDQLGACGGDNGATMSPGKAAKYAELWEKASPILDLFAEDDSDAQNRFALFWAFTDGGAEKRPFDQLENRLEEANGALGSVPIGMFAEESQKIIDWIAALEELDELSESWWRVFLPRFWRLRKLPATIIDRCQIEGADRPARLPDDLVTLCEMTLKWHALVRDVAELVGDHPFFDFGCQGQLSDVQLALDELRSQESGVDQLREIHRRLELSHPDYHDLPDFADDRSHRERELIRAAMADRAQYRRMRAVTESTEQLSGSFQADWLGRLAESAERGVPSTGGLERVLDRFDQADATAACDRRLAHLPRWAREFLRLYEPPQPSEAGGAELASFARGRLAEDAQLAMERAWRTIALDGKSTRQAESALVDETHRAELAEAYAELVDRAAPAVRATYAQRLRREAARTDTTGRTLRRLLKDAQKRRYRLSIRQFVERYWSECLSLVRPVWLCSPESVAALFPLEAGLFDRVVMDEASQCPVESALPALIRGRRLVVAGDEKQMPPSHFFARRDDDEELDDEEEDSALLSAESILDIAAVAYKGTMLRFHYRSRYEELITFSNHAFYGGRLVTAPQAETALADYEGMRFECVDGRWRDQANRVEAERVVDATLALLGSALPDDGGRPPTAGPTVGIVTFNRKQQHLIQLLLDRRGDDDESARDLLSADRERPAIETLFVKNIENVQGDERDIIVFSVGYGPTEDGGRVHARFGPIGQQGGENRLNVAVTRAKRGVLVVTSFAPQVLDVSNTKHLGPKLFRAYLDYAQHVARGRRTEVERVLAEIGALTEMRTLAPTKQEERGQIGRVVRSALATRLESLGLEVERDYGIGPYRLDLAVRDSEKGRRNWGCGIDCTRFLAVTDTLQRDVTEPAFWRRAGWKVFRVSPGLWLEQADEVVSAIVAAVERGA